MGRSGVVAEAEAEAEAEVRLSELRLRSGLQAEVKEPGDRLLPLAAAHSATDRVRP
jgi:hypothetical protein